MYEWSFMILYVSVLKNNCWWSRWITMTTEIMNPFSLRCMIFLIRWKWLWTSCQLTVSTCRSIPSVILLLGCTSTQPRPLVFLFIWWVKPFKLIYIVRSYVVLLYHCPRLIFDGLYKLCNMIFAAVYNYNSYIYWLLDVSPSC